MVIEIHTLVANYSTAIRKETVDGKEYFVAPGTLMVEGAHSGTAGYVNYTVKLLKTKPNRWDKKPLVVNHPQDADGTYVPFDSDPTFKESEVGFVNNSVYRGKLRTEYWYEMEKADKVDPRIRKNLEAGTPMGTSIGLADAKINKFRTGKDRKGIAYKGEVTDYTADHVAVLLDKKAACDVEAGCGCLVNGEVVANEASFSRISNQLSDLVYQKYGYNAYVRDVYTAEVIYTDKNRDLFKLGYTVKDDVVELSDDKPVPVKWVTEYRTLDGVFVGNCSCAKLDEVKEREREMNKTERIVAIIANGSFTEADRPWLERQDEAILVKLTPAPKVVANQQGGAALIPLPAPPATVLGQAQPAETVEQYIAKAPPAVQGSLRRMVVNEQNQKAQIVANIMASPGNTFSQESLMAQPLETLQGLERLAGVQAQPVLANNYLGLAPQPITPRQPAQEEQPLQAVDWNFTNGK